MKKQRLLSTAVTSAGLLLLLIVTGFAGTTSKKLDDASRTGTHTIKRSELFSPRVQSIDDRAIGLMDKGQLTNVITNFGVISDFHTASPALQWPRHAEDVQQYCFGASLIVLADGVLIKSIPDPSSVQVDYGWEALDGSNGQLYNDQREDANTAGDGITPLLASSDRRATWPLINGEPTWPGPFRAKLGSPGEFVENEFTSDRDLYAQFADRRDAGLRIEQIAYSYSRPYAEDILFVRFIIHNESGEDKEEVFAGFQADLKADFYADDRIGSWTVSPYESSPSFIFKQDLNGIAQRDDSSLFDQWVGPVGWVGLGVVKTPDNAGVTAFHYYHDDYSPVDDSVFVGLLTNNRDKLPEPERYFHGADSTFDDVSLYPEVDLDPLPGTEITFTVASGPFNLPAGESEEISIAFVIGADSTDLRNNVETAYFMAKAKKFQGSGPPETPTLYATAEDGMVLLSWDNVAEFSVDAISGLNDFQGYRLYKSLDQGKTWGDPLTNWYGDIVGYIPLFQCDLVDSISGLDPTYGPDFPSSHAWLGSNTGLAHSYVDEDVTNGIEVWYTLTSYDNGVFDPDSPPDSEPSYENGKGLTPGEKNTVAVIPGVNASNRIAGTSGEIQSVTGVESDATLELQIVDEALLTGHTYTITFNDSADVVYIDDLPITVTETSMNLYDETARTDQFTDMLSGDTFTFVNIPLTGDDLPAVDGFRIIAENLPSAGVREMGWTVINGDSCTFDWWVEDRHPSNPSSYAEVVEGFDDWRLTITDTNVGIPLTAADFGFPPQSPVSVPLKLEHKGLTTSGEWEDVTEFLMISDLRLVFDNPDIIGPLGWDLVPGGDGYNPTSMGTVWPDMLMFRDDDVDSTGSLVYLKTQNGPADAIAPSVGDQFELITLKPLAKGLIYEFTTASPEIEAASDLDGIKAVPNPFIVKNGFETASGESRIMFTHLPSECDITIYTVAGREVRTLRHSGSLGYLYWDLLNENGQNVAYGVYVYVVKTPNGKKFTGKLMIIR